MGKSIAISGGTLESYFQTLAVFQREISEKNKDIKSCLEKGNLPLYTVHAHALKGACANIGAADLSKTAEALEAAGQRNDLDFIMAHNEVFLSSLETLLGEIDKAIAARENKNHNEPINADILKDELSKLKAAITIFDIAAINDAAKNLKTFSQNNNCGGIVGKILQCKLHGEYDEAVLLIDKILNDSQ